MCPFCIATATVMAAAGATSLGSLATVIGLKIRLARRRSMDRIAGSQLGDQHVGQME